VRGRLSGMQRQMGCFSQGSAATLFMLGWRVYNVLTWNFPWILYTENY